MARNCYYQNRTARGQVINTNTGRSLHVGARKEVALNSGEETSPEIVSKLKRDGGGKLRFEEVTAPVVAAPAKEETWVDKQPSQQVEKEARTTPMEHETKDETTPERSRRKR